MKRIFCCILAMALLCGVVSGCTPEAETPSTTDSGGTSEASVPSTGAGANITIHEVMPDNQGLYLGNDLDWIELANGETDAVSLDGFYLTDDLQSPNALSLAGLQIPAEGYLVISLEADAPFHLSSQGETVYLTYGGSVVSQLTFPEVTGGESCDQAGICAFPTPGYPNTEDGYLAYLDSLTLGDLIISEVMASNSTYLPVAGEYYDWVEIRNCSDHTIDLSAYCLSDKHSEPERYTFPAVTLEPGEFYIVYCSGTSALGEDHAPFKISATDGETLYLSKDGSFVDALTVPAGMQKDESYGRVGKVPMYLDSPTPGQENSGGYLTGLASPAASVPSGTYDTAVTLTLEGEGTIYYTPDGSRPTTASAQYTGAITVDGVTTVRTFCVSEGRSSAATAYTYVVGVTHELPVVVVSIPEDSLTGDAGVLNHIEETYEYEAVLTLIEDGEEKFSIPCGFRLHGNDSRSCDKQNFQLRFRSEYGAGKLVYPLFDGLDITEFHSLLLKGGSEDWGNAVMRDEMATAIVSGTTNLYTQAMKPVVLYLGGEYWGVYYLRERFSGDYVASHLGVSADSVEIAESSSGYTDNEINTNFQAIRDFVTSHDMTLAENYDYLTQQIDVMSLIDWYICRSYMGDHDIANIRRFRSDESDGKWRWMFYDLDWCFWENNTDAVSWILTSSGGDRALIRAVLQNDVGRDTFLRRYAELMGTVLNESYINSVIDSIVSQIASEMDRDRERWGRSVSGWESAVQLLRDFVADGARNQTVLADIQSYFSLTDAQMESYFGNV